ncbi:hypothetical protein LCGC14_2456540, partial [marine sediment metagenome]
QEYILIALIHISQKRNLGVLQTITFDMNYQQFGNSVDSLYQLINFIRKKVVL